MLKNLFVRILLKNRKNFIGTIEIKGKIYLINIDEYKPINTIMKELEEEVL
ncbi:Uncharacterised protein [uncultured Clostridium sp.]|uniref:hypothetical protein n=1 Tax=uncultured Clostridium sp. TaxID=59620 RepID=UPI000822C15F|nr:hypothetical protein [uncultured Clostridium sp.]SCJ53330.1 Uncharacterised protein [uncultured Clostridium sp.]